MKGFSLRGFEALGVKCLRCWPKTSNPKVPCGPKEHYIGTPLLEGPSIYYQRYIRVGLEDTYDFL